MRHVILFLVAPVVLLGLPACNGLVSPSNNVLTELTGTLEPGGSLEHRVPVTRNGEFSLRVRSLVPSEDNFVHVLFGIVAEDVCVGLQQAFVGHDQLGMVGPIQQAEYCIVVSDAGVLAETVEYLIEFRHP